ncbi:hypothetical protein [Paenibacillus sp. NPDC101420]|uniref:hypothetical protein n=1 Tax=Paenibacillus sp. NPDC101420 TaxID=3390602 RepID=UPI003D037673
MLKLKDWRELDILPVSKFPHWGRQAVNIRCLLPSFFINRKSEGSKTTMRNGE